MEKLKKLNWMQKLIVNALIKIAKKQLKRIKSLAIIAKKDREDLIKAIKKLRDVFDVKITSEDDIELTDADFEKRENPELVEMLEMICEKIHEWK